MEYSGNWYIKGRQTDLDWALHSPIVKSSPRNGVYQLGNKRKLRHIVTEFVKNSSLHGMHYICPNGRRISRWKLYLFRLIFSACILSLLGSLITLLQQSLTSQSMYVTITNKDGDSGSLEDPLFPEHPMITLCRRPGYKLGDNASEQELVEYAYLALGYPYSPLNPKEITLLVEAVKLGLKNATFTPEIQEFANRMYNLSVRFNETKKSQENFNLTQYILDNSVKCQDIFVRCIALVFDLPCCLIWHEKLTTLGLCKSFVLDKNLLKFFKESTGLNFYFTFDLHAIPPIGKDLEVGYKIQVSDPRDTDFRFNQDGYYLVNGHVLSMRTKLIKTSRLALYTPWHGLSNNCPRLPPDLDNFNVGDRYFVSGCERKFLNKIVTSNCVCRDILDVNSSNASLPLCSTEYIPCMLASALKDNLTEVSKVCTHPCTEYHFESEATLFKLGVENISRLVFSHYRAQYTYEEYKLTTMSSFLSQIGGAMGLYLGASIITAIEIILFIGHWLWYRFLPEKRVSNDENFGKKTKDKSLYIY